MRRHVELGDTGKRSKNHQTTLTKTRELIVNGARYEDLGRPNYDK